MYPIFIISIILEIIFFMPHLLFVFEQFLKVFALEFC